MPKPDLLPPDRGDVQNCSDPHTCSDVAVIVDLWRQRQDLRRAEGRLDLQAQAVCRRRASGDKEEAARLWKAVRKGTGPADLAIVLQPYLASMAPPAAAAAALEKQLCKLVKTLPVWPWVATVRGFGELSLAGVIGEASGHPGDYRTVSALWKRFGLAVIDGGRQRLQGDAEAALLHGYSPRRRAWAYVIEQNLMKSQGSTGPYRAIYDKRKTLELERGLPKAHAHNRALRYMVKALLRDLWVADRRARQVPT